MWSDNPDRQAIQPVCSPSTLPVSCLIVAVILSMAGARTPAATVQKRYYAHPAVHDRYGVIAPWYTSQNGQCDFRVRVAAETLKRYPWTTPGQAASVVPHYVFNGHWKITTDGTITAVPINDWDNGDLGQRASYVLSGLVDYYRYSGDAAALAHVTYQAEALLDHCLTPPSHPWPNFLISVPTRGKAYGQCNPQGMIQLDIVAEVGLALLKAYQMTGEKRWLEACRHWGDLLAAKRNRQPGAAPWGRYANPETAPWKDDKQTGGVVFLLYFFDELIRLGYPGKDGEILKARDAGRAYLRDVLLPQWTVNDVWGRNYWDWADPVQAENVTEFAARYFMDHKDYFPNWHNDTRNILSLFLNHTGVSPDSAGEVFSGAWAYPESLGCCGRSLWYGPMELAVAFAQFGEEARSPWGRELARRMQILATYDGHETGVSEDNIDGGGIVNNDWFKIAHPMALKHLLATMAWLPEELGAVRENHIMRSTAVVKEVIYGKGAIRYTTFDAPAGTIDVLRLAFVPQQVTAEGQLLTKRSDLQANGYQVKTLASGDSLVWIRHDGARSIVIQGDDPQSMSDGDQLRWDGNWKAMPLPVDEKGHGRVAAEAGAVVSIRFTGNQVRLLGSVGPEGGLADVFLDEIKQRTGIDCWGPSVRRQQVLYYRNGLVNGPHLLKIVARGAGNPRSSGKKVFVEGVQWSAATGPVNFGEGGGPTQTQRLVLGYPGREDLKDSRGDCWRPGTEFVVRLGTNTDSVTGSWWTTPVQAAISGTPDPELYRYGVHARDFCVNLTVGPGTYHVRLKLAATHRLEACSNCVTIAINGQEVVRRLDVCATAGGPNRAADLVFNGIQPSHGVIDIRFVGGDLERGIVGEAFAQAIEVGPGDAGPGTTPVTVAARNLLLNGGFEQWKDAQGERAVPPQWHYRSEAGGTSQSAVRLVGGSRRSRRRSGRGKRSGARFRTGTEPIVSGNGGSSRQQVSRAVLIQGRDVDGQGFGARSGDGAGLVLEELDASGKVVAVHPKVAVTQAGPYRYVSSQVTTGENTVRLRFVLETMLGCAADHGWVNYDQCVLDGPPAAALVTGQVVDERGSPIQGALVSLGSQSVRTGL